MNKEFYRERILWRAEKHKLFSRRCVRYEDASEKQRAVIGSLLGADFGGVLLFWESEDRWTLLGDVSLASWHGARLKLCGLDEIQKQLSVPSLAGGGIKQNAEYLLVERPNILVWAPPGNELFALMNILLMFPSAADGLMSHRRDWRDDGRRTIQAILTVRRLSSIVVAHCGRLSFLTVASRRAERERGQVRGRSQVNFYSL